MITTLRTYALVTILALTAYTSVHTDTQADSNITTIIFDLYDVVLDPQQKPHLYTALKNNYGALRSALQAVSPQDCDTGNEYVSKLKHYGFTQEAEFISQWLAAYKINEDLIRIMNILDEKGYEVSLISNVNEYSLNDIMPDDSATAMNMLGAELMLSESQQSDDATQKMSTALEAPTKHESFGTLSVIALVCHLFINWRIICVDSEPSNISIAQEYGFEGIRLTSTAQLEIDLQMLGIL